MINILDYRVRVDDFPIGEPNKRYNLDNIRLLRELENRKIKYLLAVVPESLLPRDVEILRFLNYAYICMHGFNHGIPIWRSESEFEFMTCEQILSKMQYCTDIFSSLNIITDTFVPPFNMFDQKVLDVLKKYNYKYITGGHETFEKMNYKTLNFYDIQLVLSKLPYYTSNGHFNSILNLETKCPKNEMITFHLNGRYTYD